MKRQTSYNEQFYAQTIDHFLNQRWEEIVSRATHRAAWQIVTDRRIRHVNRFLAAAALLMALQMSWGALTLLELCHLRANMTVAAETSARDAP